MKEIKGTCSTAVVYTDNIDESTAAQIKMMCDQEYLSESTIRIMPDVHAGLGSTIGTTLTISDKVAPNMVGVDIGCGMETVKISQKDIDLQQLDELIYQNIPSGRKVRRSEHALSAQIDLSQLRCAGKVNIDRAKKSIGTLGGGNHFIEVNKDDEGSLYIVVHSGSRHLGTEVAGYYQREGFLQRSGAGRAQTEALAALLKAQGREKEIENQIKALKKAAEESSVISKETAYADGELFDDYIHDMKLTQQFAVLNRKAMTDEIIRGLNLDIEEQFTTIHNYIDTDDMILRKGAVSAKKGEKLLIPINMRDGSLICIGKGNADWNYSAPHGAGRLMSRKKAFQSFSMEQFEESMKGIYTTSVSKKTLDECPMAYKDMDEITENITPTAEIVKIIRPVYNFKAGE